MKKDRRAHIEAMDRRLKKFVAFAWTLLIVALCTIPGDNLPDVHLVSLDKIGHFAMFAVFGWLWVWASPHAFHRIAPSIIVAGLAFAGATEVYQGLLPLGREPSVGDAFANVAGLLAGIWIYRRFWAEHIEARYRKGSA